MDAEVTAKLSERSIQLAIFRRLRSGTFIPNWTPPQWWEADVARILPSGRWHEFEIKLSKADFLADVKKMSECGHRWNPERWHSKVKHLCLASGAAEGPNCFYYAMPENLAERVELPAWAGLVIAQEWNGRTYASVERKAPTLHKNKFAFSPPEQNVFYWRMWSALERI